MPQYPSQPPRPVVETSLPGHLCDHHHSADHALEAGSAEGHLGL